MFKAPGFNVNITFKSETSPDRKDKNYYYNNICSLYSDYLRGTSTVGFAGLDKIRLMRLYAEGKQPVIHQPTDPQERNKAILDQNGNPIPREDSDIQYDTIDSVWSVLSPANKIMDGMVGKMMGIDFDVQADPLDYGTQRKVEDEKLRRWAFAKNRDKLKLAAQIAGVEIPEPDFLPEQPEDLENYTEKFYPDHLMYVEQLLKHTFDYSHWSPDTVILFYRDLFTHNRACVKNEYDPETGKVLPKYVDIEYADIQASKHIDHRDSERAWHFELMNISQLRQWFPDKPEEWFQKVAGSFTGMFNNPEKSMFNNYINQNTWGEWGYDQFKVCIMVGEWIDLQGKKVAKYTNKHGRNVVKTVPYDSAQAQDKTYEFGADRMRFEARWVVGTDEVFNYGPAFDITYPSKNDTELTYKWIELPGKSKIEQLVPILDNFNDLWRKYKELLRNAQGRGMALDIDMLASTAGENDNPQSAAKKAFRRFLATDKMLFRRINAAGLPNQNMPLVEFDGGMGSLFQEIQQAFNTNINMVEYITGVNPLMLGSSADPNAPVTTSQLSLSATSNVLRPIGEGYARMKQSVAENIVRWAIVLIRGNEFSREAYRQVIGDYGIEALIAASKGEAEYGIKMIARPTELEKQYLLQNIEKATMPVQGGQPQISADDADILIYMVGAGTPVKTINYYFKKARQRQQAALKAEKMELMQTQSALNQQDAQTSMQARMAETQAKHAMDMELQSKKNEGLLGNTAIQEKLRTDKELQVQDKKNEAEKVATI